MIKIKQVLTTVLLLGAALSTKAQLNPFQASFFQNRYLYNPAVAGINREFTINTGYRNQWSGIEGAPRNINLTAEMQPTDRVGLGINLSDDKAGIIRQTRVMGTYAYHLPIGEDNEKLHFGLSLGVDDSRVDYGAVHGDITDAQISQYNALKAYVDGDFGAAYTNNRLYIGAAIPNLKSAFFQSSDSRFDADRLLFIATASYKIPLQSESRSFVLEPLAGYRAVKGYNGIIDGGFNFMMNNYGLYMQAVYHSSKSLGMAFGLDQNTYAINLAYNLETGPLAVYTQGAFELGLKIRIFGKQDK